MVSQVTERLKSNEGNIWNVIKVLEEMEEKIDAFGHENAWLKQLMIILENGEKGSKRKQAERNAEWKTYLPFPFNFHEGVICGSCSSRSSCPLGKHVQGSQYLILLQG